jgi:hypothetical protein
VFYPFSALDMPHLLFSFAYMWSSSLFNIFHLLNFNPIWMFGIWICFRLTSESGSVSRRKTSQPVDNFMA